MKPKLLLHPDKWSNATAFFLEELYQKHFDISYDLNDDGIVYAHWLDYEWAKSLNRPAIIDHLWEYEDFNIDIQKNNLITLELYKM